MLISSCFYTFLARLPPPPSDYLPLSSAARSADAVASQRSSKRIRARARTRSHSMQCKRQSCAQHLDESIKWKTLTEWYWASNVGRNDIRTSLLSSASQDVAVCLPSTNCGIHVMTIIYYCGMCAEYVHLPQTRCAHTAEHNSCTARLLPSLVDAKTVTRNWWIKVKIVDKRFIKGPQKSQQAATAKILRKCIRRRVLRYRQTKAKERRNEFSGSGGGWQLADGNAETYKCELH